MTSKEALKLLYEYAKEECETNSPELLRIIEARYNFILKDLEVLEILKPRVRLIVTKLDKKNVAFIETSGFVFKDSNEYELLKEWLKNEK